MAQSPALSSREDGTAARRSFAPPAGRARSPRPILDVARELGVASEDVIPMGRDKAKLDVREEQLGPPRGRIALVSAITPTAPGEGKTTVAIGLAMALRRLGERAALCLRQPSLAPIFGKKGGATGGGRASLVPADDLNLHFTGDAHAITTAHNLLASMIDHALHFRARFEGDVLDPRRIRWGRVLDLEDRALREVAIGLGHGNGVTRIERFDVTASSEVMAIAALAKDRDDLEERLGRILVGFTHAGAPVHARDLGVAPAMNALLRDVILPNLVQTVEGGPALVHLGPFGNVAHGASSVVATRIATRLADLVVTEAGFGFELGGEKFLDIAARAGGFWPRVVVLVATVRGLLAQGSAEGARGVAAIDAAMEHVQHHVDLARSFGIPVVVAINEHASDDQALLDRAVKALGERQVPVERVTPFDRGAEGCLSLACVVAERARASDESPPAPRFLVDPATPLREKIELVAKRAYGAGSVVFLGRSLSDLREIESLKRDDLGVCFAKTPSSLTDDPAVLGRPRGFPIHVREVRVAAGAGFVVPLAGDVSTMPGLPRDPAVRRIHLGPDGHVLGLMAEDG